MNETTNKLALSQYLLTDEKVARTPGDGKTAPVAGHGTAHTTAAAAAERARVNSLILVVLRP